MPQRERADTAHELYLSWLKDEVERWCNDEGRFEAEWDYDSLHPDTILDAYRDFEGEGYTSPRGYLEDKVLGEAQLELDFYENVLLPDLSEASFEVNEEWNASEDVWEDLASVGYRGVDANMDELLSKTTFKVNIFFATQEECDHDMGSIVNAFGNDYRSPDLDRLDGDDLDNALSYLVNQQGHSVSEVYDALREGDSENPFIASVQEEIDENRSDAQSEVATLLQMDGKQMLDFLDAYERGTDSLVLPKDHATVGIYNEWTGGGSALGILLEKDAVLPMSMAHGFSIEGQSHDGSFFTVGEVYDLDDSYWCEDFSYREGVEPHVREDYDRALDTARESSAGKRVTLTNEAEANRTASSALSGRDGDARESRER